jgi:RNA polymerase primary sigma factor
MNSSVTLERSVALTATFAAPTHSDRSVRPRPSPAACPNRVTLRHNESADAFHLYLREIGRLPLLTRDQETILARRARNGDTVAREELIKGNLRLVVKFARDYENMGLPLLDLIAEGNVGLMKAVDRFDPGKGAKLSVYASFWIKQSIRRALGNQARTIRIPIHIHSKIFGLERLTRRLQELLGRPPTDAELAQESGLPHRRLAKLRLAMISQTSLDAPLGDDHERALAEIVPDENTGTPYEHLAGDALRDLLREFLGELGPREAYVLKLRYGLDGRDEHTLQEVAETLSLTRERVRQIQQAALKKLHRWITRREARAV